MNDKHRETFAEFLESVDEHYHKHMNDVLKSETAQGFCPEKLGHFRHFCEEIVGDILEVGYYLQELKKAVGHIQEPNEGITFGRAKR